MSGIISDNQGRSSGLVKAATAAARHDLLYEANFSDVAQIDVDGYYTSSYVDYIYELDFQNASIADLNVRRYYDDSGQTLYTSADYNSYVHYIAKYPAASTVSHSAGVENNQTRFELNHCYQVTDSDNHTKRMRFTDINPQNIGLISDGASYRLCSSEMLYLSAGGDIYYAKTDGMHFNQTDTQEWTGLKFYMSTGNITGKIKLFGVVTAAY